MNRSSVLSLLLFLAVTTANASFLDKHWQKPIAPQGEAPAGFSPLEADLRPAACGSCHQQQWQDWSGAQHSKAMGPGVMGQLVEMQAYDPQTVQLCQSCHAPLHEQQPGSPVLDSELRDQGMVCAACHLRGRQVFGPPAREKQKLAKGARAPHGGFAAREEFTRSEFCAGCHQFEADGFALNGKLLENTYTEWKSSRYASQGTQCQDCHMPDRRHLWRGIHDPEMTASGVSIEFDTPRVSGNQVETNIRVRNIGTGHRFPTYVTPKVFVHAELLDQQNQTIAETRQQAVIGREVPLDLSSETYDTRIAPDETFAVSYRNELPAQAHRLRVWIEVDPDNFYRRFYENLLQNSASDKGRALIEQALENSRQSRFVLFDQSREIPRP